MTPLIANNESTEKKRVLLSPYITLFLLPSVDNLDSPEPPVFCTPGFKMKKTNGHCFPPVQGNGDPESPDCRRYLLTTPELPVYETTYMDQLISTTKVETMSVCMWKLKS